MGADWEVTWEDIIMVAVKGEDGDGGYDGDVEDGEDDDGGDDGEEDYGDQYVCRRGRTALWTSELCTWSDQRWHRPELVELLFGCSSVPSSISHYMRGEFVSAALPSQSMVETIHLGPNKS